MSSIAYSLIEFWVPNLIFIFIFLYLLVKSFSSLSFQEILQLKLNHKSTSKYNKQSAFTTNAPVILNLTLLITFVIMFKNLNTNSNTALLYLPLIHFLFCFFLYYLSRNTNKSNTDGSVYYLALFIPVTVLTTSSTNLLDFVLALELISYLFYFVIIESAYFKNKKQYVKNSVTAKTLIKSFLYYFWLSFVGSATLLSALYMLSTNCPDLNYSTINLYFVGSSTITQTIVVTLIIIGFFIKMGSFFFFFFKADLYKILSFEGVLVFSVFTSFIYLIIFVSLITEVPYILFTTKYVLVTPLFLATVWMLYANNLKVNNVYVLTGLSSVLTICFCLLVII